MSKILPALKSQLGIILQMYDKDFKPWFIAKSLIENSFPYLERNVLHSKFYAFDDKLEMYQDIQFIYQHYPKDLLPDSLCILELKLTNTELTYESLSKMAVLDEKKDKLQETMKKLDNDELKLLKDFFKNN